MKIAVVIEHIETWRGGAETSTLELSRLLIQRGHAVHLVTATGRPSTPDLVIHPLRCGPVVPPLRTAAFIETAARFLREQSFDVVHSVVPLPAADVYQPRGGLVRETLDRNVALRASRSARLLKRALSAVNLKHRSLLELERQVFRHGGPTILAVSQYVADQCRRHYQTPPGRVRVVYNGVTVTPADDEERRADRRAVRRQYEIDDSTLLLLFVAHNFRLKGLGTLIDAARAMRDRGFHDFRVLVLGRDNPVRFSRRIEALGLSGHVIFAGPTQRMAAFYHAADALAHPTYYDPCSRVVLEAIACGLPSVTTALNGAAEVMTDGREGFILPRPDDPAALAGRLLRLRDAALRRTMTEECGRLRERISMARHVDELCAVYEEVGLARRPRQATA